MLGGQRQEGLLGLVQRRPHDLGDPVGGWRLDQLRATARQQLLANAILATLDTRDMLDEPGRQRLGVGEATFSEAGVGADLGAMAFGRTPVEVKRRQLGGGHADLTGEMRDGIIGRLVCGAREAPTPQHELQ